jgi:hypothetical protein
LCVLPIVPACKQVASELLKDRKGQCIKAFLS